MKIRKGFVSNSSSSSFVCEICGQAESGYDMGLEEAGMVRCINDHIFCTEEAIGDIEEFDMYDVPAEHCPICSLEVLTAHDQLRYLIKTTGKNSKITLKEIIEKFGTYDKFCDFVKEQ